MGWSFLRLIRTTKSVQMVKKLVEKWCRNHVYTLSFKLNFGYKGRFVDGRKGLCIGSIRIIFRYNEDNNLLILSIFRYE